MSDDIVNELETKLAFLDRTVSDLNQVVYAQQKQIDRLEEICGDLARESKALADKMTGDSSADEKPPHY